MADELKKPGFAASLTEKPGFWAPGFWACITLTCVALVAAASLWGPGMVNTRGGGDSPFLLQRTHQMVANLRAGVFPVRWMPDAAYGLGYPFFSYYAALPYYLAGLLALAGADLLTAVKLAQTLGFVAAALAMYGWMHCVTRNRWAAWLAAVAYTVAPFHLVNVYVRGDSLSEFYAFIFYPLILWGLDGIAHRTSQIANQQSSFLVPHSSFRIPQSAIRNLVLPALAYAGLILTHNISALIFSPFVLLYLVILALRSKGSRWRVVGLGLLSLGFGIALAAWFWLPAVVELRYVQLGPSTQDYFHYSNHFRALNLVQRGGLFDFSVAPDLTGRSPFAMGLAQAVLAALGMLLLIVRGLRRRLEARGWFVLAGLLISTIMITPLSRFLWDHLPLLPLVQFPWRFLSVQSLFTAAATAALIPRSSTNPQSAIRNPQSPISNLQPPFSILHSLPAATLLILSVLLPLHPDRLPIGPSDVTVERLQLYELFAGNIGTTIRYEWLPNTVTPRPFTSAALIEPGVPLRAIPLEGAPLEAALVERKPTRQTWRIWGAGGSIAFPLLYWPGWGARLDGKAVPVWPVEGSGYLALAVPPGEHTVILRLGRTPVRAAAEAISLVAVSALLIIVAARSRKTPDSKLQIPIRVVGRWVLGFGLLALGVLVLAWLLRSPEFEGENDLTMDFDHMPYLHHNPEGVDFAGKARLAGYTLSAAELAPGDTLTVTLDWSDIDSTTTATLQLVSPAAVRYEVEPLTEAISNPQSARTFPKAPSLREGGIPQEPSRKLPAFGKVALHVPTNTPRGIYFLQLRLFDSAGELYARTSGGEAQGILYLRPIRVPRGPALPPDTPVLASFGPVVRLHGATVAQPASDRLSARLDWSAAQPLAANYAISLRLLDPAGQMRVATDTQPGYGFLPTSLWPPGELVSDRYLLALPDDLPPTAGYHLQVVLYQMPTLEPVGQAQVGDLALPLETVFEAQPVPRTFVLPRLEHPLGVDLREIRLAGYDLEAVEARTGPARLTLWWQALQAPRADYTVFVHLFDPDTDAIVAQSDAMPRGGAYPTSWWAAGEVVSETVTLSLEGIPEGTYWLAVGLYDQTVTRLAAVGPDGQRFPADRAILPESLEIQP